MYNLVTQSGHSIIYCPRFLFFGPYRGPVALKFEPVNPKMILCVHTHLVDHIVEKMFQINPYLALVEIEYNGQEK